MTDQAESQVADQEATEQTQAPGTQELPEFIRVRKEKGEKLKELGGHPYRNDFKPTATTADVKRFYHWGPSKEIDDEGNPKMVCGRPPVEDGKETFSIAGRVILLRSFGKAAFVKLRDRDGELQIHIAKQRVGEEVFERFKLCEVGDIIGVSGTGFLTKTKELTLRASQFVLITKAVRPLPEKWQGLKDTETRYRQRYVDLIANPDVAELFRKRSRMIQVLRRFLDGYDFLEVETPMMHPLIGGASARPFVTHHNTLKMDLFMRIAPELYLKRLLVGGFERVYEINRNFRNEGISTQHNPEFTMLEFYMAYATFEDMMNLIEGMVSAAAEEVAGSTKVLYEETELDFSAPWQRLSMKDAIVKYWNSHWVETNGVEAIKAETVNDPDALRKLVNENFPGRDDHKKMEYGELIGFLFEEVAESQLIQPTFITGFPRAISPLARSNDKDPELTDRFEVYIYGRELANAFSELNDPFDQQERFRKQMEKKAAGAEETMDYDEDYIRALEHGMPPAGGAGIGIDRLCMFLCNASSIRDVILFPQLRKEH